MGFKKSSSSKFNNKDNADRATSNHKTPALYDAITTHDKRNSILTPEKVRTKTYQRSEVYEKISFKRGMNEKEVKLQLFLLEGTDGFDEKSLRAKMTEVVMRSSSELQNEYYEKGIAEDLPSTWADFKIFVIDFCLRKGLTSIRKHKDEEWLDYLIRLQEWAENHECPEEKVLKKLRQNYSPRHIVALLCSPGVDLPFLIQRVREWENFGRANRIKKPRREYEPNEIKSQLQESNIEKVQCYACKGYGHYKSKCPKKNKTVNSVEKNKRDIPSIDTRIVEIGKEKFAVVFDSGSCVNIITSKTLRFLNNVKCENASEELKVITGEKFTSKRKVELEFKYKNNVYKEWFYIVENLKEVRVLFGNELVRKLDGYYKMPIECSINTKNSPPISWTRPIRSYQDKLDFEKLIDDLERRGIVEESKSQWLNPVVLVRKKDNSLRFCIDFRKLNEVVDLDGFELPVISELISTLRDKKFFTSLDLKDGFFQIHIKESDKEKTAFLLVNV